MCFCSSPGETLLPEPLETPTTLEAKVAVPPEGTREGSCEAGRGGRLPESEAGGPGWQPGPALTPSQPGQPSSH